MSDECYRDYLKKLSALESSHQRFFVFRSLEKWTTSDNIKKQKYRYYQQNDSPDSELNNYLKEIKKLKKGVKKL